MLPSRAPKALPPSPVLQPELPDTLPNPHEPPKRWAEPLRRRWHVNNVLFGNLTDELNSLSEDGWVVYSLNPGDKDHDTYDVIAYRYQEVS